MAKISYCPMCDRSVSPKKKFSWPIFLFFGVFTVGVFAVGYLAWYIIKPSRICPICGGVVEAPDTKAKMMAADKEREREKIQFEQSKI